MNCNVGIRQRAEHVARSGDGVGDFVLVPHRAAACGSPYRIQAEGGDARPIVAAQRGLVPAEGEAWCPAIQPQKRRTLVRMTQQSEIDSHVLGACAAVRVEY